MFEATVNGDPRLVWVRNISKDALLYDNSEMRPAVGDVQRLHLIPRHFSAFDVVGNVLRVEHGFYRPDDTFAVVCRFDPLAEETSKKLDQLLESLATGADPGRRRHSRVAHRASVRCNQQEAELVDVGKGGVGLLLSGHVSVGDMAMVSLPHSSGIEFQLSGRVVRTSSAEDGRQKVGIVFEKLPPLIADSLESWLKNLARE
jgi:hypothetical protein